MPNYQWIISSCLNVCLLGPARASLDVAAAAGGVQVCSLWPSPCLEQQDTWGKSSQGSGQNRREQTSPQACFSPLLASHVLTSGWWGPEEGAAGAQGTGVHPEGWSLGPWFLCPQAMTQPYLWHKECSHGLDDQLSWSTQKGGASGNLGLSELKAKKVQSPQEELRPVMNCPVGHG